LHYSHLIRTSADSKWVQQTVLRAHMNHIANNGHWSKQWWRMGRQSSISLPLTFCKTDNIYCTKISGWHDSVVRILTFLLQVFKHKFWAWDQDTNVHELKSLHEALQDVKASWNLGLLVTLRSWCSPCPTRILPLMRFDTSLCTVLKSGAEYEEQGQNLNEPFSLYYTTGILAFWGTLT